MNVEAVIKMFRGDLSVVGYMHILDVCASVDDLIVYGVNVLLQNILPR